MKFNKILSFLLVLIILMSTFAFAIPVNAASYIALSSVTLSNFNGNYSFVAFPGAHSLPLAYKDDTTEATVYRDYLNVDDYTAYSTRIYNAGVVSGVSNTYDFIKLTLSCNYSAVYINHSWTSGSQSSTVGAKTVYNETELDIRPVTGSYSESVTYYYNINVVIETVDTTSGSGSGSDSEDPGTDVVLPETPAIDATKYSNVLEDLSQDPDFSANKYPLVKGNYTLNLFQIAESKDGELFLYVYNPSAQDIFCEVKYINMSLEHYESASPTYKLYSVSLLNTEGAISKYLVNGLTVSDASVRYYNVAGVYTPYNSKIHDESLSDDDVINHTGVAVGKCFEAITENGAVYYGCRKISYVDVDINDHGIVRFPDAFGFYEKNNTDAHYIAITVNNFNVTEIYDVDVHFYTQSYSYVYNSLYPSQTKEEYGEKIEHVETVDHREKSRNAGGGFAGTSFLSYHYKWDSIMTAQEFNEFLEEASNEELIDFDATALDDSQYVISFYETSYILSTATSTTGTQIEKYSTIVSEVTLLRMHFATPEGVYNLGVVGDIVSDDGELDVEVTPGDNASNSFEDFSDEFKSFLDSFWEQQAEAFDAISGFVVFAIVAIVIVTAAPYTVKFIMFCWDGIKTVAEAVVTAFAYPFLLIGSLFDDNQNKSRKKRGSKK